MKYLIAILSLSLASCVSLGPELSCEGTNWYELGRQTGRQGEVLKDKWDMNSICGSRDLYSQKYAILETGYFAGLAEFCSPENAFNLGRLGLGVKKECPDQFKEAYMAAYERGQRFAEIEASNLKTDQKIEVLTDELGQAGLSLAKRALREGQRLELIEQKSEQLTKLKTLQESEHSSQVNQ